MKREEFLSLILEGALVPQNSSHPVSMAVETLLRHCQTWDDAVWRKVFAQFGRNGPAAALWFTGFATAIARLDRDERLG